MASLNLINWRQPGFRHQLAVQKKWLSGCVLCLIVIGVAYSIGYQPVLKPLRNAVLSNQTKLQQLLALEQRYQQAQEALELRQQTERANRQQTSVLRHFISLNTDTIRELQRENLTWLPGEIKITGTYQAIESVKQLAASLQNSQQDYMTKVDFPRNGHFSMVHRDESLK